MAQCADKNPHLLPSIRIIDQSDDRWNNLRIRSRLRKVNAPAGESSRLGILHLMIAGQPRDGNEDGGNAMSRQFPDVACTRTAHRQIGDGIEVRQFAIRKLHGNISGSDPGTLLSFPRQMNDVTVRKQLIDVRDDRVIQCLRPLTPAVHEEDRLLPAQSRDAQSLRA